MKKRIALIFMMLVMTVNCVAWDGTAEDFDGETKVGPVIQKIWNDVIPEERYRYPALHGWFFEVKGTPSWLMNK